MSKPTATRISMSASRNVTSRVSCSHLSSPVSNNYSTVIGDDLEESGVIPVGGRNPARQLVVPHAIVTWGTPSLENVGMR